MNHRVLSCVPLALLLSTAVAFADDDPLAVMRDPKRTWTFEVLSGTTLANLKPMKNAGAVMTAHCTITEVDKVGAFTRSLLSCGTDTPPPAGVMSWGGDLGTVMATSMHVVFDDGGMRQIVASDDDEAAIKDKGNAGAFTFPTAVHGSWKRDVRTSDGRVLVTVAEKSATLLGKSRKVWTATRKTWDPPGTGAPASEDSASFAPGIGPVQLCMAGVVASQHGWWCLRLTKVDPAP
jgi:hypothetical protein